MPIDSEYYSVYFGVSSQWESESATDQSIRVGVIKDKGEIKMIKSDCIREWRLKKTEKDGTRVLGAFRWA